MVKQSDYTPPETQACLSVLVEVMTVLGEFRENIVIVGGNVPPLLIKSADVKHPGTMDIDLAIDNRRISNDTYQTIVETLKARGYYQKEGEQPYIFYRDVDTETGKKITVRIDLLAGEYGGTGSDHRHQKIQDAQARKTRGCDLVFSNPVKVKVKSRLPNGATHEVTVKVPSIGPFLVTKGMALWGRIKEKDAFDIYYCCRYYPGGIPALVRDIKPLMNNKLAREGLGKIMDRFRHIDALGPTGVAVFLELEDPEERLRVRREAFELVHRLMTELGIEPFLE
jgi:hypothetical protein